MFSMARELGMTVAELGVRMSAAELDEWVALFQLEAEDRERARATSALRGSD
jgi:hypothetical protein